MTRKYRDAWPEDQVEILRKLWATNLSASEIGAEMGISRSTVLGKAHRLNLSARAERGPGRFNVGIKLRRARPRAVMLITPLGRTLTIKKVAPKADRKITCLPGQSKTSAGYRSQFGMAPEMSSAKLREFLAQAVRNTARA
jgi:hypothetical protein